MPVPCSALCFQPKIRPGTLDVCWENERGSFPFGMVKFSVAMLNFQGVVCMLGGPMNLSFSNASLNGVN